MIEDMTSTIKPIPDKQNKPENPKDHGHACDGCGFIYRHSNKFNQCDVCNGNGKYQCPTCNSMISLNKFSRNEA